MSVKTKPTVRFTIEPSLIIKNKTSWTFVLPKNVVAKLPSQSTSVEGIINSFPFQSTIAGNKLTLTKAMHAAAGAESASIEFTLVGEEVETRVPADLTKALATAPKAQSLWETISPLARRDWIFWIISGKKVETRQIRITKACDMLTHGKKRVCCFGGVNWLMKTGGK